MPLTQFEECWPLPTEYLPELPAGARGVICGGARGVIVIVVGNEHGDTSSNPGRD